MKFRTLGLAAIAVAMSGIPAFVHHSFAMFDGEKSVTLEGTIKEFQWTNPHSWIMMMVNNAQGQPEQWAIELGGPSALARQGWVPKTLTPGMKVKTLIHPLKDGSNGGQYMAVTLPDGTPDGKSARRPERQCRRRRGPCALSRGSPRHLSSGSGLLKRLFQPERAARRDGDICVRARCAAVAPTGEDHVSGIASRLRFGVLRGGVVASLVCAGASLWPAYGADSTKVPDFSPDAMTGWLAQDDEFIPPPSGPGPITFDPAHPYISFYKFPRNPKPSFRVADLTNPILQPWTRDALRKVNERSLAGKVVAIPKERCWPVGVPTFLVLPAMPVYFLQTPKAVWMIWMQDHQVRRVGLDVPHSANVKPSWYGESVGHYDGDTLVVDTIGITTKTYVDNYQTPHTEQLHVIERFHLIDGGKTLEVNLHVEDPGAFTTPWNAIQRYRRVDRGPLSEVVCAENNEDHFHHDLEPMPQADRPDF